MRSFKELHEMQA